MNIPVSFMSKLGHYQIEWKSTTHTSTTAKVTIVDNAELAETYITELSSLCTDNVVGIDAKVGEGYSLLVMYVHQRCIVILLHALRSFPNNLIDFLMDTTKCFVTSCLEDFRQSVCQSFSKHNGTTLELEETGVDLGDLAALVLQKPDLHGAELLDVARNAGFEIIADSAMVIPTCFDSLVFTAAEAKGLILNAYQCYLVGKELLFRNM